MPPPAPAAAPAPVPAAVPTAAPTPPVPPAAEAVAPAGDVFTVTIRLNWPSLKLGAVRMGNVAPAELTAKQIIDGDVVCAKEMAVYKREGRRGQWGRQKTNEGEGNVCDEAEHNLYSNIKSHFILCCILCGSGSSTKHIS